MTRLALVIRSGTEARWNSNTKRSPSMPRLIFADANCNALADLILGQEAWTRENQANHDCVTILGL
jgi:hypothetical protein